MCDINVILGHDVFESGSVLGTMQISSDALSSVNSINYRTGMFGLFLTVCHIDSRKYVNAIVAIPTII